MSTLVTALLWKLVLRLPSQNIIAQNSQEDESFWDVTALIATQQPWDGDMRLLAAILKIVTKLAELDSDHWGLESLN
ncbi:MAG TPA: hypothetical protein VLY63_09330 [Anaerolineae bacterium]|nr:hypothetical protein [Anaerolineae bacterium]